MRHKASLSILSLMLITSIGCSRTYIRGSVDSPDKKYRFVGKINGAYGRSYMDVTDKSVELRIFEGGNSGKLLLSDKVKVFGGNLGWEATWDVHTNLSVWIYDRGAAFGNNAPKKDVETHHYVKGGDGKFVKKD